MATARATCPGAELTRVVIYHRFEISILNTSISFKFLASVQQVPHAQVTRASQEASATTAPGLSNMASAAHIDRITEDMTEDTLSYEVQEMQRATRDAYLSRLSAVSNRNSLRCLEAAAKAELDRITRLDVESLKRLERATARLGRHLVTPPKKEQWRYNVHSSPEATEVSSSSSSKRIHSLPSRSPTEYSDLATDLRMDRTAREGQSRVHSGIAALSSHMDAVRAVGTIASSQPKSKIATDDQQRFVRTNGSKHRAANIDRVQKWLDEGIHGSAEGLDLMAGLESETIPEENLNEAETGLGEFQGSNCMSEEAAPSWQDTVAEDSTAHREDAAAIRAAGSPALAAESARIEDDWSDVGLDIDD